MAQSPKKHLFNLVKAEAVALFVWPSGLYGPLHLDPPILNFLLTFCDLGILWPRELDLKASLHLSWRKSLKSLRFEIYLQYRIHHWSCKRQYKNNFKLLISSVMQFQRKWVQKRKKYLARSQHIKRINIVFCWIIKWMSVRPKSDKILNALQFTY